jgi:hypothetical protein
MKHIKLFDNFNTNDILMKINWESEKDRYQSPQIRTNKSEYNEEFIKYLWEIADIKRIDALGGTEAKDGMRRYNISDLVSFEDVIHMAPTGIAAGIKITKYPLSSWTEYDQWPGGYIEGFIRMDSDDKRFGEYFIWTYIKMDKLENIINKFEDKLNLLF